MWSPLGPFHCDLTALVLLKPLLRFQTPMTELPSQLPPFSVEVST